MQGSISACTIACSSISEAVARQSLQHDRTESLGVRRRRIQPATAAQMDTVKAAQADSRWAARRRQQTTKRTAEMQVLRDQMAILTSRLGRLEEAMLSAWPSTSDSDSCTGVSGSSQLTAAPTLSDASLAPSDHDIIDDFYIGESCLDAEVQTDLMLPNPDLYCNAATTPQQMCDNGFLMLAADRLAQHRACVVSFPVDDGHTLAHLPDTSAEAQFLLEPLPPAAGDIKTTAIATMLRLSQQLRIVCGAFLAWRGVRAATGGHGIVSDVSDGGSAGLVALANDPGSPKKSKVKYVVCSMHERRRKSEDCELIDGSWSCKSGCTCLFPDAYEQRRARRRKHAVD